MTASADKAAITAMPIATGETRLLANDHRVESSGYVDRSPGVAVSHSPVELSTISTVTQEGGAVMKPVPDAVLIPAEYPCATFFVDESSARSSSGSFFVLGAVELRKSGELLRAIQHIRDSHQFDGEFKFNRISRGKLTTYYKSSMPSKNPTRISPHARLTCLRPVIHSSAKTQNGWCTRVS